MAAYGGGTYGSPVPRAPARDPGRSRVVTVSPCPLSHRAPTALTPGVSWRKRVCQIGKETKLPCMSTHTSALPETQRRVTGTSQVLKVCPCLADVIVKRQG